ncbi:paramyosin-like isoform X1 [Hordeum vulgare subsp. vulgare]|nr:paramyosin-like isoform X1 [Hordeum vulgare subsp. vulgare]
MQTDYWTFQEMRRFFPFRSFTSNAGEPAPAHDKKSENKLDEGGTNGASHSPDTRALRSRRRHGKLRSEESPNPQLGRCLSFTSSAIDHSLDERAMRFSGDIPWFSSSNVPRHVADVECYTWSPERHPNIEECMIKVPKAHGVQETDSPRSRCYSCSSTGHSPLGSPIALKCRPARLANLLDKNEVLDLYIDGEQEAHEKHKQKFPIRTAAPHLGCGRPPRPQSTAPSSPKSCKEIYENYSNIDKILQDLEDGALPLTCHHQLAQEGAMGTLKARSVCDSDGNDTSLFEGSSDNFSHSEECKSHSVTTVEDIYEDSRDLQPQCFYGYSVNPLFGATSRCSDADTCHRDGSCGFHNKNLEEDTDDKLLRRTKELDACFMVPSEEMSELNMLRDKRLNSTDIMQLVLSLIEDRKQLALELSSQVKARLTERFAAKEQYKQSKVELDSRTRSLENEKTDVQTTLERELDRRSNDWSARLARFQAEEQRLRDRVMELAEQNVSFQREVTLFESKRVEASNKITSLELQNKQLNDEMEKVKGEHTSLYRSSVELHDSFTKAAEERDQIQECLKSKEDNSRALHKVIARLQGASNEQEKTINGLRQGFSAELENRSVGSSESITRMQIELLRLTGVEQKLRKEIQSCNLEVESLQQENIGILNRLQSSGNGLSLSSHRLDLELHARVDNLQMQGLSLLEDTSCLCGKLLGVMKSKSETIGSVDALADIEYTLKYQNLRQGMDNLALSLRKVKSVLVEKHNKEDNTVGVPVGHDTLYRLKEEALLNRVLKEKLLSRELDIEQLQSDVASFVRIQDVMQNEIRRSQDEVCRIAHKFKHFELQVLKKDESINQMQQDFQESAKELTTLRCNLKSVSDERDSLWQETKHLRKTVSTLQNDVASLKQKIKSLDEDIQLKEGEILLHEGEISILRDSIDRPFDIICSPRSMKQLDME